MSGSEPVGGFWAGLLCMMVAEGRSVTRIEMVGFITLGLGESPDGDLIENACAFSHRRQKNLTRVSTFGALKASSEKTLRIALLGIVGCVGAHGRLVQACEKMVADIPWLRTAVIRALVRPLAVSATTAHRDVAALLLAAIEAGRLHAALAMALTAQHRPDLRAEKVVSHRYRFLWICNPKVASRSMIEALLQADPAAELLVGHTLDVFAARPEVRDYYSFAFIRHPYERAFSFFADKHGNLVRNGDPRAIRYFVKPYHGVREGMTFAEFCCWLNTPFGSDAFADRHWLSQHMQIELPDGSLPDFVGRYERIDDDWKTVMARLGLPQTALPRRNSRHEAILPEEHLTDEATVLLRRRYAEDLRLGGYS